MRMVKKNDRACEEKHHDMKTSLLYTSQEWCKEDCIELTANVGAVVGSGVGAGVGAGVDVGYEKWKEW